MMFCGSQEHVIELLVPLSEKPAPNGTRAVDDGIRPISNTRNNSMLKEARAFAKQLDKLCKDLPKLEHRYEGNMGIMKAALSTPLPRAYHLGKTGVTPVGNQVPTMPAAACDKAFANLEKLKTDQQKHVLEPIKSVLSALKSAEEHNDLANKMYSEVMKQCKALNNLQKKLAKSRSAVSSGEKGSNKNPTQDLNAQVSEKHAELERSYNTFTTKEESVYNSLILLTGQMSQVKYHIATAIALYRDAFTRVHDALVADGPPNAAGPPPPQQQAKSPHNSQYDSAANSNTKGGSAFPAVPAGGAGLAETTAFAPSSPQKAGGEPLPAMPSAGMPPTPTQH